MSGIVLQAKAIKIINKGGGVQWRIDRKESLVRGKPDTGSDYVVFICPKPGCGHRNKQSMYESESYHDVANDRIPFKCKMCRTTIEVTRPAPTHRLITLDEPVRRPTGRIIVESRELERP